MTIAVQGPAPPHHATFMPTDPISRREMLRTTAAAAVAGGGLLVAASSADAQQPPPLTPASLPPVDGRNASNNPNTSTLGPKNPPLDAENRAAAFPPSTDKGEVQTFKFPFSFAHKKTTEAGWARQVTIKDLEISRDLAAVDMRLVRGGVRELHWHESGEWSFMLAGTARLTAIDADGRSFVGDLNAGDLWYFPSGIPHSIQGLGDDGCEFLLVFDDGKFSEYETFLISEWLARAPRDVVAKNLNVPVEALANLPKEELYIFSAPMPGPLEEERRQAAGQLGPSPHDFIYKLSEQKPTRQTRSGEVHVVDSKVFPVSTTVAAALVTVRPGGLRELHWHPNADEWQYYVKGRGRMTLFPAGNRSRTMDFEAGDVGYVPITQGHYIENTGDTDLQFLEVFKSSFYQDLALSEWITHVPPTLAKAHLKIDQATLDAIPREKNLVVPA